MGETNKSFMQRFTAAFVAASTVFLVILGVVGLPRLLEGISGPLSVWNAIANALDTVALCLAIIVVVLFVVAYPVERWLVKPTTAAWKASLLYLLVFAGLTILAACTIPLSHYPNVWPIVLAIGFVVAGVVAAVARLLYPLLLKSSKTSKVLAIVILIGGLLGPLIPPQELSAPIGAGIFPALIPGELGRGTMNLNSAGVYGSDHYDPQINIDPSKKYELSFSCLVTKKPMVFQAFIRSGITGKQFFEHDFTCNTTDVQHVPVDFGNRHFDPSVLLFNKTDTGGNWAPDAWAILAPVGAVR